MKGENLELPVHINSLTMPIINAGIVYMKRLIYMIKITTGRYLDDIQGKDSLTGRVSILNRFIT